MSHRWKPHNQFQGGIKYETYGAAISILHMLLLCAFFVVFRLQKSHDFFCKLLCNLPRNVVFNG